MIDSQSVKTTESGGIRLDAGKKIDGRKNHILVDTIGLMVGLVVHAADIQNRDGAPAAAATLGGVPLCDQPVILADSRPLANY